MSPEEEAANRVLQEEEFIALSAIYEGDFDAESSDSFAVTLRVPADPSDATSTAELSVVLSCHLPTSYPSSEPPYYELTTDWRNDAGIAYGLSDGLRRVVENTFMESFNPGEVVIFEWVEALKLILESRYGSEDRVMHAVSMPPKPDVSSSQPPSAPEDSEDGSQKDNDNAFAMVLPTNCPTPIIHSSEALIERKSIFMAHAAPVSSPEDVPLVMAALLSNKRIGRATHNIMAYRLVQNGVVRQDYDDDGETAAGARLLHMLGMAGVNGAVVVVSRWYGGVQLGPMRFKCINNCARKLLESGGYIALSKSKKGMKR